MVGNRPWMFIAKGVVRCILRMHQNPGKESITGFNLYSDGLPHVHPNAWLAVIEAAMDAKYSEKSKRAVRGALCSAPSRRTGLAWM